MVEGYTITEIGSSAFADSKLREVTIPASVKVIGQWAFSSCENLTKVRILGAEKLGGFAFYFCTNLASVELGEKLTEIGSNAFVNCRPLKKIVFPKILKKIGDGAFTAAGLEGKLTLPENLVSVGEGAFSSLSITELTLPDTLETMGSSAFAGLSIRKLAIPGKIAHIENSVFSGCDQLEYVYIPKSVKSIESNAFGKGIVYDAFGTPLKAVYYGGDETAWKAVAVEAGNEKLAEAEMHYGAKASDLPQ